MITAEITCCIMLLNSVSAIFSVSPLLTAIPIPSINASVSAVITPNKGGISIVKNDESSVALGLSTDANVAFVSIRNGKTVLHVKYVKRPAKMVEPYAINAVTASKRPAPFPKSAMPGATNPTIIRGIQKNRNEAKMPLNVTKTRTTAAGKTNPNAKPKAMAVTILGNKPIFLIFI